ncbi:MAG: FRG domain-containing protein [Sedimentisphaerales bacterium]|nr:FRG domain-containing protein [Sedimentisphaerales bacterium]
MERTHAGVDAGCKVIDTMQEKTLECWEEFEEASAAMISDTKKLKKEHGLRADYPLFRGVGDSTYHLESSLERIRKAKGLCPYTSFSQYWHTTRIARKHIETVTGKKWDLDAGTPPEVPPQPSDIPAYEFMAYLRHTGFPSPLLDWTKSPYIAAFFAFRDVCRKAAGKEHVSIFAYREFCGKVKGFSAQEPHICHIGPCITTFPTHYLQQSEYSICVREEGGGTYFANHEDVKAKKGQDDLVKYNIPVSEREKVLRRLDLMNVTAYSLFHSEPSLMDTLAIRELVLEI